MTHEFSATILAVPEPASLALLGLGMTGLLLRRRVGVPSHIPA